LIFIDPPKESTSEQQQSLSHPVELVPASDNGTDSSINPYSHRRLPPLNSSTSFSTDQPRDTTRSTLNKSEKHSNSCSTIYVDDSTVSQPNYKAMIKCVSIAIHSHVLHRKSNKTMDIFDEKLHPLTVC
jgi:hypothetical protein